jgi:tetratricopeptide (TPR) repeat protein
LLKALKIDNKNPSILGNLGWIFYCENEFKKCIRYSNMAIALDSNAYYAMFNIALATLRLGKFEESKNLYKNYFDLSNKHKIEVHQGAIDDLNNLIKKNIKADEANFIINNIFKESKNYTK